jgi:phage baseplate assembly protein gpV
MDRKGTRGIRQKGNKVKASSSQGPLNQTKETIAAWMTGPRFKYLYTNAEKKLAMEIKVVRVKRLNTTEEVTVEEVKVWVDDPFFSKTYDTEYFKLEKT